VLDLGEDIRDGSYREVGQISGGGIRPKFGNRRAMQADVTMTNGR